MIGREVFKIDGTFSAKAQAKTFISKQTFAFKFDLKLILYFYIPCLNNSPHLIISKDQVYI